LILTHEQIIVNNFFLLIHQSNLYQKVCLSEAYNQALTLKNQHLKILLNYELYVMIRFNFNEILIGV
jgi:hypothetical protein